MDASRFAAWGVAALVFAAPLWMLPLEGSANSAKLILILAGILLILGILVIGSWGKRELIVRIPWLFFGAAPFVAASLISLTFAKNPFFALGSLLLVCLFIAYGLAVAGLASSGHRVRRFLGALLAAGAIASIIALLQAAGLFGDPMLSPVQRATSTFGNRNFLGSFLGIIAIPTAGLFFSVRRRSLQVAVLGGSVICVVGALLVQQTGILLALLVGLVFVTVGVAIFRLGHVVRKNVRKILVLVLVVSLGAGAGLAMWVVQPHEEVRRTSGLIVEDLWAANYGTTREIDWRVGWEMFRSHPWTGVGLGNYKASFLEAKSQVLAGPAGEIYAEPIRRAEQAHNEFVQVAAELGIPGILAVICCFGLALACFWIRICAAPGGIRQIELLMVIAGLVVAAAHAVVSFPFHLPVSALSLITLLGLASSEYFGDRSPLKLHLRGTKARVASLLGCVLLCAIAIVLGRELSARVAFSNAVDQIERGDLQQAQFLLKRSIDTSSLTTNALYWMASVEALLAEQAKQAGESLDARSLLESARTHALMNRDRYPTEEGLLLLAGVALKLDDVDLAEATISTLLDSNPRLVFRKEALYLRAAAHGLRGDTDRAEASLRDLIGEVPEYVYAYILLGTLLRGEGNTEEAFQVHEMALGITQSELARIELEAPSANQAESRVLEAEKQRLLEELRMIEALLADY